ncbi:MAG: TdeIII family type II restriction endonuclease [Prevotellaceae bacterium]|jgi:hypothetical protein|nr:TdeIII family type II restriction endonuclease [Prevotellaceae bacterium]
MKFYRCHKITNFLEYNGHTTLYSFIRSLSTNFGTSIFEPVAESLAH